MKDPQEGQEAVTLMPPHISGHGADGFFPGGMALILDTIAGRIPIGSALGTVTTHFLHGGKDCHILRIISGEGDVENFRR